MYIKNNYIYADPYKVLVGEGVCGLRLPATEENVTEEEAGIDDMAVYGSIATWGGGRCAARIVKGAGYAEYKTRLIKVHYSLDDQMAVMLNGDDEEMARMQAWRAWAAAVAHKIVELVNR